MIFREMFKQAAAVARDRMRQDLHHDGAIRKFAAALHQMFTLIGNHNSE
jgi:hypothetical protein